VSRPSADPEFPVLFFDGYCHLCDRSVQFVLRFDRKKRIRFAALQSDYATRFFTKQSFHPVNDSLILWYKGKFFEQSDAALRIAGLMGFPVHLLVVLYVFPGSLRNVVYRWIAKNRFKWLGKRDACRMPEPGERNRFLDQTL